MKKTRKPTPEERVCALYPAFEPHQTVELLITQLDLVDPTKKAENVVLFTQEELIVWREGEIGLREKRHRLQALQDLLRD